MLLFEAGTLRHQTSQSSPLTNFLALSKIAKVSLSSMYLCFILTPYRSL